jgi:hypothetical protein
LLSVLVFKLAKFYFQINVIIEWLKLLEHKLTISNNPKATGKPICSHKTILLLLKHAISTY